MAICPGVGTLGDTTKSIEIQLSLEGCELLRLSEGVRSRTN